MDHQDISEHLVMVAMTNGDDMVIERAPINPIVYLEPPILWLSGPLGMVHSYDLEITTNIAINSIFVFIFRN